MEEDKKEKIKIKSLWENLKFAWKYSKDQKSIIIKYTILSVISIVLWILYPYYGAKLLVYLTEDEFLQLIGVAVIIFIIGQFSDLIRFVSKKYSQIIYRESFSNIQIDLGKSILKLENSVIDKNGSGVFIQRLTNDTSRLADIFNVINTTFLDFLSCIGIFIAIFIVNIYAFLFISAMTLLLYIIENNRAKNRTMRDKKFRKSQEKVSGFVGEIVRGARDIKMLNAEKSFISELKKKIVSLNQERYEMQDVSRKYGLLADFVVDLTDLLLILLLIYLIKIGNIAMAEAVVIYNYSGRTNYIVGSLGMFLDNLKDFNLSATRIFDIINSDEFKKEKFGKTHLNKVNGDFEFKHVSFSYDEKEVLNDLSFKIKRNSTVAFVGKSGSGKSTIFSLLCKMYDINEGTITIDGVDIKELDKDSIRGNITIISQNPYIFNLSIRDNLRLVKSDLTEEEMIKACKIACLDEFIEKLPDKYDTIIGEGGVNLSGGQKQRLAIARALVQKTEIILFDEATSALDNETQSSIQKAIENMKREYTILIIAHRLSTIINSDRILFLDEGKIEMEGTHEELLKKSKKYKHLYESEITKEESKTNS